MSIETWSLVSTVVLLSNIHQVGIPPLNKRKELCNTMALGSNIGYAGKSLFGKLKSAHAKAKGAAMDKGIFI